MASSLPAGNGSCSGASSTYIRSQYNLNPPPAARPHSPDPLPGYCPGQMGSEGPPSTIGDFNWGNTTTSSIDGGSVLGSCTGCHHDAPMAPGHQPTYLSSAMSTSSADSGSVSGSGSRTCGSNSGSGSAGGGSRRPSNFKSFTNHPPSGMSQPKAVFGKCKYYSSTESRSPHLFLISVRPQPSSPFKRPLLSSTPCSAETELTSPATINPRGLNFTPMPAMAEVRSPDVLHPQDGPCDCLSQGLQVRNGQNSQNSHESLKTLCATNLIYSGPRICPDYIKFVLAKYYNVKGRAAYISERSRNSK